MSTDLRSESFYLAIQQQREGPFSYEEVVGKLQRAEINFDTLIWYAGLAEWQKISALGIFKEAESSIKIPAIPDLKVFSSSFEWLQISFEKTKEYWGGIVLSGLLYLTVVLLLQAPTQLFSYLVRGKKPLEIWQSIQAMDWTWIASGIIFVFLVLFISNYIKIVIATGYKKYVLSLIRGESNFTGRTFEALRGALLPLFLFQAVSVLLVMIGFCCLLLPGIYLSVCYLFAPLFIIDRKVSFWEGMEIARRQVHRKWFRVFWYLILSSLVAFSGLILVGFGLLFTMPMGLVGFLMIYENLLQEEIRAPALIQKTSGYPEVFAANLCVFPGIGTWLGGKIVTGIIQMIGASIGVLFLIYGMVEIIRYWDKLPEAESWFRMSRHGLIHMGVGLIITKIFWLWGLWSAWRYKQEELRK